jgi:hypothetical protein
MSLGKWRQVTHGIVKHRLARLAHSETFSMLDYEVIKMMSLVTRLRIVAVVLIKK